MLCVARKLWKVMLCYHRVLWKILSTNIGIIGVRSHMSYSPSWGYTKTHINSGIPGAPTHSRSLSYISEVSHTSEDSSETWLFNNLKDGVWRKIGSHSIPHKSSSKLRRDRSDIKMATCERVPPALSTRGTSLLI
jgi:hypothetical protein